MALDGAARSFGAVKALDGVSFAVPAASVTALLGPNGAGKTTTVRAISGVMRLHRGTVRVFGLDPVASGESVRARLGIVSARPALYDRLSGRDNLVYSARLYGVPADGRIEEAAARFGIDTALGLRVGGYSTGMKRRLALARATLHDPDLLLLDEPTAGLDPESARAVLGLVQAHATAGKTVIVCTHLLAEAEGLADQIVIMDRGRALLTGSPGELARRFWPRPVVVLDAEDRTTLRIAETFEGVLSFEQNGEARVEIDDIARVPDLVAFLIGNGVRLRRVDPHVPTLEDLYFKARGAQR